MTNIPTTSESDLRPLIDVQSFHLSDSQQTPPPLNNRETVLSTTLDTVPWILPTLNTTPAKATKLQILFTEFHIDTSLNSECSYISKTKSPTLSCPG